MKKLYIAPVADIAVSQMQTYLNDGSDKASWGDPNGNWHNEGNEGGDIDDDSEIDAQIKHRGYSLW